MVMKPWKVERTSTLLSHPRVVLTEEVVRLPDGTLVEDYLQIKMAEHVAIIVRSRDRKILLQRQYKHGPRAVSLTFPAGEIEQAERPFAAARRELQEETGIVGRNWRALGRFVLNGNQGAGAVHLFFADHIGTSNLSFAQIAGGDLEEQEPKWVTKKQLIQAVQCGEFRIASHALAATFALNARLWPPASP